jgi:hypothetical protein
MREERIYFVGTSDNNIRLVRAVSRQQALMHVAHTSFVVRKASQDDLVSALTSGVKVENYRAPEQTELNLEN